MHFPYCCMTFSLVWLCPWLHIASVQNNTQIFRLTYNTPSNMNQKEANTWSSCSGRHWEGLLGCSLLFLTQKKHTGNFYGSAVICKQAHSFFVWLTLSHKQGAHGRMRWLRGLGAFEARSVSRLRWITAMMWRMLSVWICQRALGTVLTEEWVGPTWATAASTVRPFLSEVALRHALHALSYTLTG